jgi:hypothetical protein
MYSVSVCVRTSHGVVLWSESNRKALSLHVPEYGSQGL